MTHSKRFNLYIYVELISAILFTLLTISFHADISLLAFPICLIFTGISVYFGFFKFLKLKDAKKFTLVLKLIQYMPFVLLTGFIIRRAGNYGTSTFYDFICVFLWIINFIFSFLSAYYFSEKKKNLVFNKGWKNPPEKVVHKPLLAFLIWCLEWVDALVQAVFLVLLLQIFVAQLYSIPSESMVPTLLISDRLVVTKVNCGPKFPLTDIGLPDCGKYKRGDIVVFRSPHYKMDRKANVKTVCSQIVYMLTFTKVNLDKDEYGNVKYDPLVKRICAQEGEQILMQDGVLYSRTKDQSDFEPVLQDNQYAAWNLNELSQLTKIRIRTFPLTQDDYESMIETEELRKTYDLDQAASRINSLKKEFSLINKNNSFVKPSNNIYELYNQVTKDPLNFVNNIVNSKEGRDWYINFASSWENQRDVKKDIYQESNYRLNIMVKDYITKIILRYLQLSKVNQSEYLITDKETIDIQREFYKLAFYISILDQRNLSAFPESNPDGSANYIPKDCYFMMGDNRFNSLDLRHSFDSKETYLTKYDPSSVIYISNLNPQYVNKSLIVGKPQFRIFPFSRAGKVQKK